MDGKKVFMKEKKAASVFTRPVICVCQVDGKVGVVLRQDYDRASQDCWTEVSQLSKKEPGKKSSGFAPHRVVVEPVFLFKADCPKLKRIIERCFPEKAIFHLPIVPMSIIDDSKAAEEYLFDKKHLNPPTVRYISDKQLHDGCRVRIIEAATGEAIDEATILTIQLNENGVYKEVCIRSENLHPNERTEFAFCTGDWRWRMLSGDPMTGGRCYSQRSPGYHLEAL